MNELTMNLFKLEIERMINAISVDSDETAHPRSLIRVSAIRLIV